MLSRHSKTVLFLMLSSLMIVAGGLRADGDGRVFLSRITDNSGNLVSRSILAFHEDGTLAVTDASQQGSSNYAPFGIELGYWKKEHGKILIKTVDFNYPKFLTTDWPTGNSGPQEIAVVTGAIDKNTLTGTLYLSFFPLSADINDPSQASALPVFAGNISLDLIAKPK